MKKQKWFPVPPYHKGSWIIVNEKGEQVATFEDKDECIIAAEAYNEYWK